MRVVIDTNVILDAMDESRGFAESGNKIIELAIAGEYKGFLVANSVTDISYIMRRNLRDNGRMHATLDYLSDIFHILPVKEKNCLYAIGSPILDYEDAVIEDVASRHRIKYIVTRNVAHFRKSRVKILQPEGFLIIIDSN